MTYEIGFFERSARLSDADLAFIVAACNEQMVKHLAPAYRREPWTCTAYRDIPAGAPTPIIPLRILDDISSEGAIGFHSTFLGMPWGRVQTPDSALDGTTFSHEAAEAWGDPNVDQWVRMPDGREMALELCDPCQRDFYIVDISIGAETRKIRVSDCVLPSYWDPNGRPPFTLYEKMTGVQVIGQPFGLSAGGYAIVRDRKGETSAIYAAGDATAGGALDQRRTEQLSRTYRRGFRGALEPRGQK